MGRPKGGIIHHDQEQPAREIHVPSLFDALAEGEAAMESVARHAGEEWCDYARRWIMQHVSPNGLFITDDLWRAGLDPAGNDGRAIGLVIRRLKIDGVIEATGEFRRSALSHGRPNPVWVMR